MMQNVTNLLPFKDRGSPAMPNGLSMFNAPPPMAGAPLFFNMSGPVIRPAPERAEDFRNVRLFIFYLTLGDLNSAAISEEYSIPFSPRLHVNKYASTTHDPIILVVSFIAVPFY